MSSVLLFHLLLYGHPSVALLWANLPCKELAPWKEGAPQVRAAWGRALLLSTDTCSHSLPFLCWRLTSFFYSHRPIGKQAGLLSHTHAWKENATCWLRCLWMPVLFFCLLSLHELWGQPPVAMELLILAGWRRVETRVLKKSSTWSIMCYVLCFDMTRLVGRRDRSRTQI